MVLLELLPASFVGVLFCESLVFFFLLLLQLLPLFLLLRVHLFLLFLIFLILLSVTRVWRRGALHRRQVVWMDSASSIVVRGRRIVSPGIARPCVSRTAMNGAALLGGNDSATVECVRCGSGSNRRLATINRSAQLRIGAGFLNVLSLGRSRGKTSAAGGSFFLWARTSVNSTV